MKLDGRPNTREHSSLNSNFLQLELGNIQISFLLCRLAQFDFSPQFSFQKIRNFRNVAFLFATKQMETQLLKDQQSHVLAHTYNQFKVSNSSHVHYFRLWEEGFSITFFLRLDKHKFLAVAVTKQMWSE